MHFGIMKADLIISGYFSEVFKFLAIDSSSSIQLSISTVQFSPIEKVFTQISAYVFFSGSCNYCQSEHEAAVFFFIYAPYHFYAADVTHVNNYLYDFHVF